MNLLLFFFSFLFFLFSFGFGSLWTSDGDVNDLVVRVSLIEQIIKDVNLMRISFSAKSQTSTDISGTLNEFLQYAYSYFQYVHIPFRL